MIVNMPCEICRAHVKSDSEPWDKSLNSRSRNPRDNAYSTR